MITRKNTSTPSLPDESSHNSTTSFDSKKKKTPLLIEARSSSKGKEKKSSQNATTSTKNKNQEEPLLIEAHSARTTKEKKTPLSVTASIKGENKEPSSQAQGAKPEGTTTQSAPVNLTEKDKENRKNTIEDSTSSTPATPVNTTTPARQEQRNDDWYASENWTEVPEPSNANTASENAETPSPRAKTLPEHENAETSPEQKQRDDAWYTSRNWIEEPEDIRSMAHRIENINLNQTIENIKIAEAYNVSPYLVDARKDFFSQKYFSDEMEKTLKGAPKTAEWFNRNPNNAVLLKADIANIAELERLLHLSQLARYEDITLEKRDGTLWERGWHAFGEGVTLTEIAALGAVQLITENFSLSRGSYAYTPIDFYKNVPMHVSAEPIKNKIKEFQEELKDTPFTEGDWKVQLFEDVIRQTPQVAGIVLTTLLTGPAGGATLGAGLATGSTYAELRSAGVSENRAALAAMSNGAANALLMKLPLDKFLKLTKTKGGKETLGKLAGFAFTDTTTSLGQTYADKAINLWATAPITGKDPLQTFSEHFWEYTKEALYSQVTSVPITLSFLGVRIPHNMKRSLMRDADVKLLKVLDTTASESHSKKQLPAEYQNLLAHVSEGADVQSLSIAPEAMRSALGSEHRLFQALDDVGMSKEEFARAEFLGGDIEIPLSKYIEKIAGTETSLALRDYIKTNPDGMTRPEQRAFEKNTPQHIEDKVTEQRKILLEDDALSKALSPIEQELATLHGEEVARSSIAILKARAKVAAATWSMSGKEMTPAQWITDQTKLHVRVEDAHTAKSSLQRTDGTMHNIDGNPEGGSQRTKERPLFQPSKEEIVLADRALERDAKAWAVSVDIFLKGGLKEREPVTMLEKTPLVLQMLGAGACRIQTKQHILKKVMLDKHKLSADVVKQIPKAMADPIMIFESASQKGRVVMMLDIKDASGATVVVPIALEKKSSYKYAVHFVPSMYGRKNTRTGKVNNHWFINQIKEGNLCYIDQKKSQDWLRNSGIPEGTINLDKETLEQLRASKLHLPGGVIALGNKTIYTEQDLVNLREKNPTLYQNANAAEGSSPLHSKETLDAMQQEGQQHSEAQSFENTRDPLHKTLLTEQEFAGEKRSAQSQEQQGVRGSIVFKENETLIRVFKESADISTFVHETGHLFIKDMENIVATGSAPEHVVRDLHTLKEFTGEFSDAKKLQAFYEKNYSKQRKEFSEREFASLTEQEKKEVKYVAEQEKLADAFVTYLQEGKAPSRELGTVFKRFKTWLQSIYKNVYGRIPINEEIRSVFDRMLASEQEIALTEELHSAHPKGRQALEKITSTMLDTKEQQQLADAREQATALSQESHLQKTLQAFSRTKKEKENIYAQAKEEVTAMPVYAAQDQAIRQGGLDMTFIQQEYGEKTVKALQKIAPRLLRKQGSVELNTLAVEYGFSSGQALIEAMQKTQGKDAEIARRANKKIRNHEVAIQQELGLGSGINPADKEYYSNPRLESLALEARALMRSKGEKGIPLGSVEELRAWARSSLEALSYKERSSKRLSHAEAKQASRAEKALAKGDIDEAIEAKLKQIINHAMVLEAIKLKKQEKNAPIQ